MPPARWIAVAAVAALLAAGLWIANAGGPSAPLPSATGPAGGPRAADGAPGPSADAIGRAARADVDPIGGALAQSGGGSERRALARGRLVDVYGRPRAGARVWIDDGNSVRRPAPLAATTSGPDGRFELIGVAIRRRSAWLSVRDPAYAPFDQMVGADDLPDLGDLCLQRGGTVTGRVVSDGDLPVSGATVRLSPASSLALLRVRDRDQVLAPASSGVDGRFELGRVPIGTFRIEATAAHMLRARARDTLAVEDAATLDVGVLRLGPASVVRGQVVATDGTPIDAARVVVRSTSSDAGFRDSGSTDASGAFEFEHVPPSTVQVMVSARGYVSSRRDDLDATRDVDVTIAMLAGLTIDGRCVDGATGAPVESFSVRPVRLGSARADDASPFERVALQSLGLEPPGASAPIDGRLRVPAGMAAPTPHPDGTFAVDGLDEGIFAIEVRAPGFVFERSDPVELRAAGTPPPPIVVTLRRGARLGGRVVSIPGEGAVADALVALTTPGDPGSVGRGPRSGATIETTRSDARGAFVFDGVEHGRYRIEVRHGAFAETRSDPFDVSGDRDDLRIEARLPAQLFGRVAGLADDELGHAKVVAFGGAGRMRFATVDADGNYEIGPLVPGPYLVRAFVGKEHRFLAEEPELFQQRPPEAVVGDVVLGHGERRRRDLGVTRNPRGALVGIVRENGAPIANARLRPGTFAQVRTDATGRYEVRDLPAGPIDVVVRLPDASQITLRATVTILAGAAATWDAEFLTGGMRGTTAGAGLDGIDATAVLLPLDAGPGRRASPVSIPIRDGRFDAGRLPSGPAILRVPIPGSTDVVEVDVDVPVRAIADVVVRRS